MCGYFCIGFIDLMLAGKKLTDFTSLFSPHDFEKNDSIILSYFQDEWNRWNKLDWSNKISTKWSKQDWNYFNQEINQRKLCSKKINKYFATFDYIDKVLIVISATSGGVCIISSVSVFGAAIGIA